MEGGPITDAVPKTLQEEALKHHMYLIQTSGIYGMRCDEMHERWYESSIKAIGQKYGLAFANELFRRWKRRHTYNNRLKRHHEPMKRRGELTLVDINVKKWKRRRKYGRLFNITYKEER